VTVRPFLSVMSVFWYWSLTVREGSAIAAARSSIEKRRETPLNSGPPDAPTPPARSFPIIPSASAAAIWKRFSMPEDCLWLCLSRYYHGYQLVDFMFAVNNL
jgi:hypothetical protein